MIENRSLELADVIWRWEAEADLTRLRALYSLCELLQQLAAEALEQATTVPDCPYCELARFYRVHESFVDLLASDRTEPVLQALNQIENAFDLLTPPERACFSRDIFQMQGWAQIRKSASDALTVFAWEQLSEYRPHLANGRV